MYGDKIFTLYDDVKKTHSDIDEWLTESVALEYSPEVADAIQAASLCVVSDDPWEAAQIFEKVALILNGRPVIGDVMQDLSIKEIAYAVSVLKRHFSDEAFGDDVCRYIAYEAGEEGFVIMPPQLDFVQRFVPLMKLTADQQAMQMAYLQEVADYLDMMNSLGSAKEV